MAQKHLIYIDLEGEVNSDFMPSIKTIKDHLGLSEHEKSCLPPDILNLIREFDHHLSENSKFTAIRLFENAKPHRQQQTIIIDKINEAISEWRKSDLYTEPLFEQVNEISSACVLDINDEVKKYFKKYPERLYALNPRKFEELVASIFKDFGFEVELTKITRDGGRDIIASIRNAVTHFLAYVECKKYAPDNKIDVGIIREVAGVHYMRKPSKSIIVTTSFFTKDARREAECLIDQIDLKDYDNIKEWLQKY